MSAYSLKEKEDILAFLLNLNLELVDKESKGEPIMPPGLPPSIPDAQSFVTSACVSVPTQGKS